MSVLSYVSCKKFTVATTGLLAGLGILAAVNQSSAASKVAISGTFDCTYTKKEVAPVGAPEEGHILMLDVCQGKNTNKGAKNYMDGASVEDQEILDLNQGNGPQNGYSAFTYGGDSIRVRYEGRVATTLKPDKTPKTTFKGKWTFVWGAGQYAGVSGEGTYTGKMVSETAYQVDWTGSYSLARSSSAAK
jgi:hypothetical protein